MEYLRRANYRKTIFGKHLIASTSGISACMILLKEKTTSLLQKTSFSFQSHRIVYNCGLFSPCLFVTTVLTVDFCLVLSVDFLVRILVYIFPFILRISRK